MRKVSPGPRIEAQWVTHPDGRGLARALARALHEAIDVAVEQRGEAAVALAGGSTPGPAYELLDGLETNWSQVSVIATDERWVPSDHELSNERMFRETLPTALANGCRIVSLAADDHASPDESLPRLTERLGALPEMLDLVVLGMGADGHTASLFPDDPGLEALLDADAPLGVARPPSQPTPRITLTPARLVATRALAVAISGDAKRTVLQEALTAPSTHPVGRVLLRCPAPITIHWTP